MTFCTPTKAIAIAAAVFALGVAAGSAKATPVFFDNFESGLTKWNPIGSAQIVTDPIVGSNQVLNFTAGGSGGDIFSSTPYIAGGTYFLSFDILGTCSSGNCGGFIGINQYDSLQNFLSEVWLVGDNTYAASHLVQNDRSWQHFEFTFTVASDSFRLKVEDFVLSPPAGDVYFDNICVSTSAGDAGCRGDVPEPGSLALVGLGLFAAASLRKRAQVKA